MTRAGTSVTEIGGASRVEIAIGWCHVATAGLLLISIVAGLFPPAPYPVVMWAAVLVALPHSIISPRVLPRFFSGRQRAWIHAVVDAATGVAFVVGTGAGDSPAVGVLTFPVILVAMRLGIVQALGVALGEGISTILVVLTVSMPGSNPLWRALAWQFVLIIVAVLVGTVTWVAEAERKERVRTQRSMARERRRRQAVEEAIRNREELMRVVVHEFRTPVASLEALSRHLAMTPVLADSASQEALRLIQCHAEHLSEMVDALRQAATSRRRDALDRIEFRDALVPELMLAAVSAAGGTPSSVKIEVDDRCLIARIDAARTRRIVTNLVENALRYNDSATPVLVAVRPCGEEALEFVIADRGPGLGDAARDSVFHHDSQLRDGHGTAGLGLWIVDQLVRGLRGTVEACPRDGGGLEVHVVLPIEGLPRQPLAPNPQPCSVEDELVLDDLAELTPDSGASLS